MADNTTLNSGSGGDAIATDDIAGVKYQRVKLIEGADGANDGDISSANPLPVVQTGTLDVGTVTTLTGITNALPAGTNAIGKLAANSGVDIGDVDVTSVIPGTGATNLGKAIDTATGATDTGVLVLATRDDALSALTPIESDNVQLRVDANGALWVKAVAGDAQAVLGTGTYTEASSSGVIIGAVRRDADTTLVDTTNEIAPLQVDANGYLKVEVFDGGGTHTIDAPVGTPAFVRLSDGAAAITTLAVSLATVPSHAVTNAGTFAVQVDGSALTALQLIDNPVLVDDAAFTPAASSVMMSGFEADETAADSVDEGDAGAARMTLDRKVIVTPQPHTTGGLTIFRSLDLDETEEDVKTSAGQIYAVTITNFATTTRYIKFSNLTAANTTVGTSAVFLTIPVPGNASDDTTLVQNFGGHGVPFDTALCAYATTGLADADTGAPAANDVAITVFYK